jgi:predicted ATP-dependent serine protease
MREIDDLQGPLMPCTKCKGKYDLFDGECRKCGHFHETDELEDVEVEEKDYA